MKPNSLPVANYQEDKKEKPEQFHWIVPAFLISLWKNLLAALKGHTVGALGHGGVCLVGADLNLTKGTVVYLLSVILTLLNAAFDILVFHI